MYKKVTLTRLQVEKLAVFLQLQENVESVTIEETSESGIGVSHWAVYHQADPLQDVQEEITDVSNW